MSKKVRKESKPQPTPWPENWENASWEDFDSIAIKYPEWFRRLAAARGRNIPAWQPYNSSLSPKRKFTAYVLLQAQVDHWKSRFLDLEFQTTDPTGHRNRQEEKMKAVGDLWRRLKIERERKAPVFGGLITKLHPWLAETHSGPDLRLALGYSVPSFQRLREDAKISAGPKKGVAREYRFQEAMLLLAARISLRRRPGLLECRRIAEDIWAKVKYRENDDRKRELRRVLCDTGAACGEPAA